MSDQERIARLERVVGTLISWLAYQGLRSDEAKRLLDLLETEEAGKDA